MDIYVVQPGDTLETIANRYDISPGRLAIENDITDPNNLIPGEALIVIRPKQIYMVQEEDTLESIARDQGTEVMELLRNNPNVSDRKLYIGEELVISYEGERTETIHTNGMAFPFINRSTLYKTLPYLTYLTIYAYEITNDGELVDIDDLEIIQIAKGYGVAPVMFISAPRQETGLDVNIAHRIISEERIQNTFIESILTTLQEKDYYGVNIETPYIEPQDKQPYVDLISKLTKRLNREGFMVAVTLAPSVFEASTGIIYEGVDYTGLSQAANEVMYQLTYAWRFPWSLPISTLPFDAVLHTLDQAIELISRERFTLGVSNIGYLWEFPYFTAIVNANFLNYGSAIQLAKETGSVIEFNEVTFSAYFQYIDRGHEYMAWFKDIRILSAWIIYARSKGVEYISIWNIMYFVASTWMFINAKYIIEKIQ